MGCDYYINKYLRIKFQNIDTWYIQVEEQKGYFNFYLDNDDYEYDEKYSEYVEETLTPILNPIIVYAQNQFVNSKLQNKYKTCIEEELNMYNTEIKNENKIEWKDIIDITKIEKRHERL